MICCINITIKYPESVLKYQTKNDDIPQEDMQNKTSVLFCVVKFPLGSCFINENLLNMTHIFLKIF